MYMFTHARMAHSPLSMRGGQILSRQSFCLKISTVHSTIIVVQLYLYFFGAQLNLCRFRVSIVRSSIMFQHISFFMAGAPSGCGAARRASRGGGQ